MMLEHSWKLSGGVRNISHADWKAGKSSYVCLDTNSESILDSQERWMKMKITRNELKDTNS